MYCSNNLPDCNFTEILLFLCQLSNPPAVDQCHFLFVTTRNIFANELNVICTANHNYQFYLVLWLPTTNIYLSNRLIQVYISSLHKYL